MIQAAIVTEWTTESIRVVRVLGNDANEWVVKVLNRPNSPPRKLARKVERQTEFQRHYLQQPWQPARELLLQYQWRAHESQWWPELNPQWLFAREGVVVSRHIAGRKATLDETRGLYDLFRRSQRGYLQDLTTSNVRMVAEPCGGERPVVIDFCIAPTHADWLRRRRCLPPRLLEPSDVDCFS
jgi:hypothetical protein